MTLDDCLDDSAIDKSISRHFRKLKRNEAHGYHIPMSLSELERYAQPGADALKRVVDDARLKKMYAQDGEQLYDNS